jgi:predicted DNA-binding transcriptional regulator YafY
MDGVALRTLRFALENDRPVILCYRGDDGITQRRIYVRKIREGKITAYCTLRKGVRVFREEGVLSAQLAEK